MASLAQTVNKDQQTEALPRRPFSDLLSLTLFAASIVMLSANWWQFRVAAFILRAAWRYGDLALAERYGLNAAAVHESLPVARFSWMEVAASTFLLLASVVLILSRLDARCREVEA